MKNKMDFSIGVDIEDISRFSKLSYTSKKSFYDKIFTKKEIKYCLSKKNPYPHFTVRFCAKEATIKALENSNLSLKEIEIKMKNEKTLFEYFKYWRGQGFNVSHFELCYRYGFYF